MNSFIESVFQDFLTERFGVKPDEQYSVCFEREENAGELFGFGSKLLFGRIVYMEDGENRMTQPLAIKQTADVALEGETDNYAMQFANEIHFFTKVVPTISALTKGTIEPFFPKFLYSCSKRTPDNDKDVIIYENLRAMGFQAASSKKKDNSSEKDSDLSAVFPDYTHLSLMMRKLGQFHAHSIAAAKTNRNHFQLIAGFQPRLYENFTRKFSNLFGVLMKKLIGLLRENPLYETKLQFIEETAENLENSLFFVNIANSRSVLCHGDYTIPNVLFKYDKNGIPKDMKMLDLGLWRLSSPVLDVSHVLYINADQEMRDRHWNDLINDYFDGLADILPACDLPSRSDIDEEFHVNGWYAFLIASFFVVNRIAAAKNVPNIFEEVWSHYPGVPVANIPSEELEKFFKNYDVAGKEATKAVLNVLKDMVDRNII